jgi:hypothetical protein
MDRLRSVIPVVFVGLLVPLAGQTVYPRGPYGSSSKTNPGTLPDEPLATFRGIVQGAGPKLLVVKTETDTVNFECSKKTTYQRGANKVKAGDVKDGDPVAVEARHTIDGKVMAVSVILDPPPEPKAKDPSDVDAHK